MDFQTLRPIGNVISSEFYRNGVLLEKGIVDIKGKSKEIGRHFI